LVSLILLFIKAMIVSNCCFIVLEWFVIQTL
jgi:hypothetical protein